MPDFIREWVDNAPLCWTVPIFGFVGKGVKHLTSALKLQNLLDARNKIESNNIFFMFVVN